MGFSFRMRNQTFTEEEKALSIGRVRPFLRNPLARRFRFLLVFLFNEHAGEPIRFRLFFGGPNPRIARQLFFRGIFFAGQGIADARKKVLGAGSDFVERGRLGFLS